MEEMKQDQRRLQVQFLTRDGCKNTPLMLERLKAAIDGGKLPIDYIVIPQASLSTCSVAGPHEVVSYVAVNTEKPELEAFAAAAGRGVYPRQPVADAVHGIAVWQALVGSADSGSPVLLR